MHIAVTDLLTCPACGPTAGLVLLADEISDRRVMRGTLGCPSCRTKYAIRHGIALLDEPAAGDDGASGTESVRPDSASAVAHSDNADPDEPMRWAALLGVTAGPGHVLLIGAVASIARDVAAIVPDIEIIAASRNGDVQPAPCVSVIRIGANLPVCGGRVRAVALSGSAVDPMLEHAARAVMVGGRLVMRPAPADAAARLTDAGMQVLALHDDTIVAQRG